MAQIVFLTLFLGLTLGPQPIELTVTGPVAAVELLLDGRPDGGTALERRDRCRTIARASRARRPRSRRSGGRDRPHTAVAEPAPSAGRGGHPPRKRSLGPARRGAAHLAEPDR